MTCIAAFSLEYQKIKRELFSLASRKPADESKSDGFLYMFYWKKQVEVKTIHKKETIQKASSNMNILTSTELLRKTARYKEQYAFFWEHIA